MTNADKIRAMTDEELTNFVDNFIRIAQWPNGQQKVITCKNCGAPVHDNICEYCGTEY